jgi:predicted nucleic acid-binding protein
MHLMPADDRVLEVARRAFGINVRAIDALHVATAQVLAAESGEPVEFWTHDERQARAARARGLDVRGL